MYFHFKIYLEMQSAIWFLLKAVDISLQASHECSWTEWLHHSDWLGLFMAQSQTLSWFSIYNIGPIQTLEHKTLNETGS